MIIDNCGKPFKNEFAARMYGGRIYKEYKIIPIEGGFAIETSGELKEKKPAKTVAESTAGDQKKHKITTPWRPATLLEIPERMKNQNFVYRFAKKDRPGNIQKKVAEQWEVDAEISKKLREECPELYIPTINDGCSPDSTLNIREMVLMRMPKELKQQRDEYYESRNSLAQSSSEKVYKQENRTAYGKVTIEHSN